MSETAIMTAEELFKLPDDGYRHELVRGELITMTPTGGWHGAIAMRIGGYLNSYVSGNDLGVVCTAEAGFKLFEDPDTVRAPDISFVSRERIPREGIPEGFWPFAPDLAVEVISPSDRFEEVQMKVEDYLRAGTRMVWIVEPRTETVTVYRPPKSARILTSDDALEGEDVIPGFLCEVRNIFKVW
ncbi:MAG: Uma2 family endonuclease [bacterium]